jgi:hypothetical protein
MITHGTIGAGARLVFWTIFLALTFRVFTKTPLTEIYLVEDAAGIALGVYFLLYCLRSLMVGRTPQRALWWLAVLTVSMAIWSGFAANREFGQPLIYGFLAQRDMFMCLAGPYLYLSLRNGKVTLADLERAFVALIWICTISYFLLVNILDPRQYSDVHGFVVYHQLRGGYVFHFNALPVVLGVIYYLVKAIFHRRPTHVLATVFFISYILFVHMGRSLLVALLVSLAIMVLFLIHTRYRLRMLVWLVPAVVLGVLGLVLTASETLTSYGRLFDSASLVLEGQRSIDPSANARLWELAAAVRYIAKNPLTGSGELSYQWNGGFKTVMGYFYTADIGLVGIVFVYGVVGLVLVHLQYVWIYRFAKSVSGVPEQEFLFAIKIFALYYFLNSIVTGDTVFYVAVSFLLLAIFAYQAELRVLVPGEAGRPSTPAWAWSNTTIGTRAR